MLSIRRFKLFILIAIFSFAIWFVFAAISNCIIFCWPTPVAPAFNRELPPVQHPDLVNGIWQIRSSRNANVSMENVTDWSRTMSIPKIIHQTFPTEMVYRNYLPLINSCLTLNPDWDYYLWRDSDAESFIARQYPKFLTKYRAYKDNLERADSIRYIVLHHFGGIYLDMDVECKRPFFPALSQLPAFIDQERTEQSNIMWSMPFSAMNSAMGSAVGHPFFQLMIDAMSGFLRVGNAFDSTGPRLLTQKYKQYSRSTAVIKGLSPPVALLEPKVMSPLMDSEKNWRTRCHFMLGVVNWSVSLAGCRALASKQWRMDDSDNSTLAVHRFLHLGYKFKAASRQPGVNITKMYPGRVKFYR